MDFGACLHGPLPSSSLELMVEEVLLAVVLLRGAKHKKGNSGGGGPLTSQSVNP